MRRPDDPENDRGLIRNWLRSWLFTAICGIVGFLLAAAVLFMGGSEYDLDIVFVLFAGLALLTIFISTR